METPFLIVGIICLVAGIILNYSINRRRFYRRNNAGLETFSSYEKAVGTSCLERIGKLTGLVLIALGALMLFGYFVGESK